MGSPDFVRLLINPESQNLAIEVCDHTEPRKHRIPNHVMNSKQCYEICSSSLCDQLCMHTQWDDKSAYKLFATAQAGEQLLVFNFDEAYLSIGGIIVPYNGGKRGADEVQPDS